MDKKRKNSHIAPGPMAGYLFQPVRALYWLVKGPRGATVGIETEDDVVVLLKGGGKIYEQDKSSIKKEGSPFGDKSYALWNTLAIWLSAINIGKVEVEKANFLLVSNKAIPRDSLIQKISEAKGENETRECYRRLKSIGSDVKTESKVGEKVAEVLGYDEMVLNQLICQIDVETFGSNLGEVEKEEIISLLHLTDREAHDVIIDALLGWLIEVMLDFWNAGEPAWITREALDNRLDKVRGKLRRRRFRASPARELLVSEEEKKAHTGKVFVKQLEIICLEEENAYDAIIDFIRCGKERRRLAQEGNATAQDWDMFHESLKAKWKTVRGIENAKEHKTDEKLGQAVYWNTMAQVEPRLGEIETEQYLVKGSYHRLADKLMVGWHPEYKNRLEKFCKIGMGK